MRHALRPHPELPSGGVRRSRSHSGRSGTGRDARGRPRNDRASAFRLLVKRGGRGETTRSCARWFPVPATPAAPCRRGVSSRSQGRRATGRHAVDERGALPRSRGPALPVPEAAHFRMPKDPEARGPPTLRPLSQASPEGGRGEAARGAARLLNSASVSLFPPPASTLPAPVSPWVSGGGKAPVCAKLTICLCAKLTGGWTSTQTPLMATRPLCWRPRSPALAPCRLQPLPTPTPAALAPRSTPEPPTPQPRVLGTKSMAPGRPASFLSALVSAWGATVASLGTSAQGQPTQGCRGKVAPPALARVAQSSEVTSGHCPGHFTRPRTSQQGRAGA